MASTNTRSDIIMTADQLFYEQGFEKTSFAQIAKEVQISKGNFYHHFKSKDDLLSAVIEHRLVKTQKLLDYWQEEGRDPKERIQCFIRILITNLTKIKSFGCPVGTLTSELNKLEHDSLIEANEIFTLFRDWLKKQFMNMGFRKNAEKHAMHVLGRSQGIAVLANAYKDDSYVKQEVKILSNWVQDLKKS